MYWQGCWLRPPACASRPRGFLLVAFDSRRTQDRRSVMALYKFVVGQTVGFNNKLPWMSGGPYEVVSVLPVDDGDSPTYRIKSKAEPFAHAAKETDLVAVGSAP